MPRKKATPTPPLVPRLVRIPADLEVQVRIKLAKETTHLKTLDAHTFKGLVIKLLEGWVSGKTKL